MRILEDFRKNGDSDLTFTINRFIGQRQTVINPNGLA